MLHKTEISCVCFWLIVVKRALIHFKVPISEDFFVAIVLVFQKLAFVISDLTKFTFFGSIPEVMLEKVPSNSVIVNRHRKKHVSGARPMPDDLQKATDEANKP